METYSYRFAGADDAEALLDIYSYYVDNTTVSFEYITPSICEFRERLERISHSFPYLLCEADGAIAGYAYASKYMERAAYRFDAEVSVYVAEAFQGRKIGKGLYGLLLGMLKDMGYYNVYATIALPNEKSVRFHKACGFSKTAVIRNTGYKFGKWIDILIMEKNITDYGLAPEQTLGIDEIKLLPAYRRLEN